MIFLNRVDAALFVAEYAKIPALLFLSLTVRCYVWVFFYQNPLIPSHFSKLQSRSTTRFLLPEVIFHRYFTYSVSTCHSFIVHKKMIRCCIPRVMVLKSGFHLCCDVFIRLSELKRACCSHTFGYTNQITSKVIQIRNLYRHSNAIVRQRSLCITPL